MGQAPGARYKLPWNCAGKQTALELWPAVDVDPASYRGPSCQTVSRVRRDLAPHQLACNDSDNWWRYDERNDERIPHYTRASACGGSRADGLTNARAPRSRSSRSAGHSTCTSQGCGPHGGPAESTPLGAPSCHRLRHRTTTATSAAHAQASAMAGAGQLEWGVHALVGGVLL